MNKTYEQLLPYMEKSYALNTALTLLSWDEETLAPREGMEFTSKAIGTLSNELFSTLMNPELKKLLKKLSEEKEQSSLSECEKAVVKNLKKSFDELEPIPQKDYRLYSELIAKASSIWASAKAKSCFEEFAPTLKEIVEYNKKFAKLRAKDGQEPYDVLLNTYEEGFTMEKLDEFFGKIKSAVVPLLQKVKAKNDCIDKSYNFRHYEIDRQREFCRYLAGYEGFDFNRGVMAESEHPFTTNLHNHDVRITSHFYENNLESGIFSVIHEAGHAMYEMNVSDELTLTPAGGGSSMGMHESQSRFFENIIGRSADFWLPIYGRLQETFPEQLSDVPLSRFIQGINKAEPSLIRTEADELTYPLHIIIRYEIERMLFHDEITVDELPRVWNQKYKDYLGVEPSNDAEGVLQDVHWSGGSFGYFPSYAIGSAIAAQIYAYMKKVMPFDDYLREGNLTPIREFLRLHIHQYGSSKNTTKLLQGMMNEDLNADYYVDYLTEKYTRLYGLEN